MVDVKCELCGTVHHASLEQLGGQLRCAGCGAPVLIALPPKQLNLDSASIQSPESWPWRPTKSGLISLWSKVISSRPGRRILIRLLSFVVTAILISVSVEFFGRKQPSNEAATISASAAKSESQEVASARAPAPASEAPLVPPPQNCQERDAQRLANGFLLGDEERTEGHGRLRRCGIAGTRLAEAEGLNDRGRNRDQRQYREERDETSAEGHPATLLPFRGTASHHQRSALPFR